MCRAPVGDGAKRTLGDLFTSRGAARMFASVPASILVGAPGSDRHDNGEEREADRYRAATSGSLHLLEPLGVRCSRRCPECADGHDAAEASNHVIGPAKTISASATALSSSARAAMSLGVLIALERDERVATPVRAARAMDLHAQCAHRRGRSDVPVARRPLPNPGPAALLGHALACVVALRRSRSPRPLSRSRAGSRPNDGLVCPAQARRARQSPAARRCRRR